MGESRLLKCQILKFKYFMGHNVYFYIISIENYCNIMIHYTYIFVCYTDFINQDILWLFIRVI